MIFPEGCGYKDSRGGQHWKCTKGDGMAEESKIREDSTGGEGRQDR